MSNQAASNIIHFPSSPKRKTRGELTREMIEGWDAEKRVTLDAFVSGSRKSANGRARLTAGVLAILKEEVRALRDELHSR